ncbi:quinone oxidoreductase family protein [Spelaeicoccus albus]|uniref:NADPH:quinone reductase-like Zn-dependent oxidoreductase n=1 Tax=Spelaeicoccus albus TaxID=1280376 RepID=A0A7Z0ABL0_9MICO|nr:NADP-dependent oxidoreductase [Spelaeicoccus albus]NYI66156.1 NADPH:quinone reductase-like Zn-dependent oxidoreductase [Spelaeicoccus albus]
MKVIGVTEFGGPDVLGVHEVEEPHPGPGEARIAVRCAAVSPTDTGVRAGGRDPADATPPYVPGMDAAGVIDEVGADSPWQVGDEVMAMALPLREHGGAYAEKLVGASDSMARIPANTDFAAASTLPMNGLTAVQILEFVDLEPGQTLAVTGAAGTLGGYLIQLARHAGLRVIADAAPADRSLIESLGADVIVDRGDDVSDRIREATDGSGADAVVDAAVMNEKAVPAVRDGGTFVSVRYWKGEPTRGITFHSASVFEEYHSGAKLDRLRQLTEDGVLTLRVAGTFPAAQAADVHRQLEAGGVRGRLVLTF